MPGQCKSNEAKKHFSIKNDSWCFFNRLKKDFFVSVSAFLPKNVVLKLSHFFLVGGGVGAVRESAWRVRCLTEIIFEGSELKKKFRRFKNEEDHRKIFICKTYVIKL